MNINNALIGFVCLLIGAVIGYNAGYNNSTNEVTPQYLNEIIPHFDKASLTLDYEPAEVADNIAEGLKEVIKQCKESPTDKCRELEEAQVSSGVKIDVENGVLYVKRISQN